MISDAIDRDFATDGDYLLQGDVAGDVSVRQCGNVRLYGTITGNLILSLGASAIVYGTVKGNAYNGGGYLVVRGTVHGDVVGSAFICDGAEVHGEMRD